MRVLNFPFPLPHIKVRKYSYSNSPLNLCRYGDGTSIESDVLEHVREVSGSPLRLPTFPLPPYVYLPSSLTCFGTREGSNRFPLVTSRMKRSGKYGDKT